MKRKRTTVELDVDLTDWIKATLPDVPLWSIINNLLRAYKEQYEQDPPPNYYVRGAKAVRELIDRDLQFEGRE